MKKIFIILCFAVTVIASRAQYVNIPDSTFRAFLLTKCPTCFNASGLMDTTCNGVLTTDTLNMDYKVRINSIEGVQYFKSLRSLSCSSLNIITIPVLPPTIQYLQLGGTKIKSINSLPDSLKYFTAEYSTLTSLPSKLPSGLISLYLSGCNLSYLPPFPNTLQILNLYGGNSQLTCLPKFPPSFREIEIKKSSQIKCFPNYTNGLFSSLGKILPLCTPTNNINACQSYPRITGVVFIDSNNNGILDAGEVLKDNIKIQSSDGFYSYTNLGGQFEMTADSIGSYSVSPNVPSYYTPLPITRNYMLTGYDTLIKDTFALQANAVVDSMSVSVIPYSWRTRPGAYYPYLISYENIGTTIISPIIRFNYDSSLLTYDSSNNQSVVHQGAALTFTDIAIAPGQRRSSIVYFRIKTSATIGDTLVSNTVITANASKSSVNTFAIIRASYDPNNKLATPVLSTQQVSNGNYIDYTIHFQNTGTDTAVNIVVADTLSSKLQAGRLEMLNTSHSCNVTQKDNKIIFEFLHINLPDSSINKTGSNGYINFRIKPITSLVVDDTINNKASIYFDYNAPIITNNAVTIIQSKSLLPLNLTSFNATLQGKNFLLLKWATTNEINTKEFILEQSMDAFFNSIVTITAKGSGNNIYTYNTALPQSGLVYYRLKIIDKDGQYTYSPIITIKQVQDKGILILGNPAEGTVLKINTTDALLNNTEAVLINELGVVVRNIVLKQGVQQIDICALPSGVYYLHTPKGSQKILIKK